MPHRIALTTKQRAVLAAVARSAIGGMVYWTGGTLLAVHYLHHRLSKDLDFFTEDLPDDLVVAAVMRDIGEAVGARKSRHVRFPNRWQYFLELPRDEELKLELVYFPFPALGKRPRLSPYGMRADSLRDLAANKAHAAFERAEPRDAFDLYVILQKERWTLTRVVRDVERKFGVALDLVHLVARLQEAAARLPDLRPLAVVKLPPPKVMSAFFQAHANRTLRQALGRR